MINEDWNDIQASINGDDEAYRRLVHKYQVRVARMMWRFTRNSAECERLVQDVFIEAYFGLKGYHGKAPFLHWLRKIGTRIGYRFWKEQDKERQFVPLLDSDFIEKSDQEAIDPTRASEILQALLTRLKRADRLVLTLMYFEDCSTEQIARRTGWTRAAVKMRALRARRKIRQIAEKENLLEKLGWIR